MSTSQRPSPDKAWCMRPDLHKKVLDAIAVDNLSFYFNYEDSDRGSSKYYDTHVMGRFHCRNKSCSSVCWASKKIAISIRLYAGRRYNARIFRQRCKDCNELGRAVLDQDSYVERVAYRLKKWSGIEVARPYFRKKSGKPHVTDLCEGCQHGHCGEAEFLGLRQ